MGLILSKENFQAFLKQTHKILENFINLLQQLNVNLKKKIN